MEKQLKISVGKGKFVYGSYYGKPDQSLIIFIHGFTGYKDEHIFFNGSRFFNKHGFSSFRFNLYGEQKDARKLHECTLSMHGKDLDAVISYFRKKGSKNIIVTGHSFGGVTILLSQKKDFNSVILWDPSDNPKTITNKARFVKELDLYYFDEWGVAFAIGKKMVVENKKLHTLALIKKVHIPIKIIVAGDGALVDFGKAYYRAANEPKSFASIPGALHTFDQEGTEEKLFQETLSWLKQ